MPSFPDAVWAPTAKAAGNTIQAAHVNDMQDEVVAVEAGYRNGTAPLNSSGSTLATLNVSGGSTLASLDVNGNSTLASSITFGSIPYVLPSSGGSTGDLLTIVSTSGSTMGLEWRPRTAQDAVQVQSTVVNLTNNTTLAIPWTHQVFALNSSLHSTGTNPERFTPQSTGLYSLTVNAILSVDFGAGSATAVFIVEAEDSSAASLGRAVSGHVTEPAGINLTVFKRFDVTGGWLRAVAKARDGSTNSLSTATRATFRKL